MVSLNEVIKMGEIIGLILTIILGLFAYFLCYINYLKRKIQDVHNKRDPNGKADYRAVIICRKANRAGD